MGKVELMDATCQKTKVILWADEFLHHFETMGNNCLLVFPGES